MKLIFTHQKRAAYFTNLAVHPDFPRAGHCSAFEKAEQELRAQGVEKLAIFTREDDASHLYQKWGGE